MEGDTLSSPMEIREGSKAFISFRIWHASPSMPIALGWHFQFLGEEGREETYRKRKCDLFLKSIVFESCQWKMFPKGAL